MFKAILALVSFANAGKTVISIDDELATIPGDYAKWVQDQAMTVEGQAVATEIGKLYKKASLKIAVDHGKVLKPATKMLDAYLKYLTLNKDCKKDLLVKCMIDNDIEYFSGDGTWGACGTQSNCFIKFTNMTYAETQKGENKLDASSEELEKALDKLSEDVAKEIQTAAVKEQQNMQTIAIAFVKETGIVLKKHGCNSVCVD